ncbi:MAG TPA: polyprenol monophosphomannose synthase [Candidatus Saccharimonadales bacterium]|nr:polyprenol monophosphomannose synthase [Candidatus Saccharimonadales bacterium]
MNIAIAIPTYNEAGNIEKLLSSLARKTASLNDLVITVFIIDDNSPDKTGEIAKGIGRKLKSTIFSVAVIDRPKKEGLGKAYIDGFSQILKLGFDFILQMDADFSHDPKYLTEFVTNAGSADFIVGSRYVKGGGTPDWAMTRKLQSRLGNFYTRVFLGSRIHDYTGGYNMYSTKLLQQLDLNSIKAGGYGFLIELKYKALKRCKNAKEIAIIFKDRQHGKSKIPRSTILKNLLVVPHIKFSKN